MFCRREAWAGRFELVKSGKHGPQYREKGQHTDQRPFEEKSMGIDDFEVRQIYYAQIMNHRSETSSFGRRRSRFPTVNCQRSYLLLLTNLVGKRPNAACEGRVWRNTDLIKKPLKTPTTILKFNDLRLGLQADIVSKVATSVTSLSVRHLSGNKMATGWKQYKPIARK